MTSDELKRLRELHEKRFTDDRALRVFDRTADMAFPYLLDTAERLSKIERLVGELRTAEQQRLRESGDTTGDSPTLAGSTRPTCSASACAASSLMRRGWHFTD